MGVPPKLDAAQQQIALNLRAAGPNTEEVAKIFRVSPAAIGKYARQNEIAAPTRQSKKLENAWNAITRPKDRKPTEREAELDFLVREHVFRPLAQEVRDETNIKPYIAHGVESDPHAKLLFDLYSSARHGRGRKTPEFYANKIVERALFASRGDAKSERELVEHAKTHVYTNMAHGRYMLSDDGRDALDGMLTRIEANGQFLIEDQYGINRDEGHTPKNHPELAAYLGITTHRVKTLETRNERKLKYLLSRNTDVQDRLSPMSHSLASELLFLY